MKGPGLYWVIPLIERQQKVDIRTKTVDLERQETITKDSVTALITAGLSGIKGHIALMETLHIIEANVPESSQLIISFAKTKVKENTITHEQTKKEVMRVMDSLIETMNPLQP